jgi:hypothetical protein
MSVPYRQCVLCQERPVLLVCSTRNVLQIRNGLDGYKCCPWLLVSPWLSHFTRAVIQLVELCTSVFDHTAQERKSTGMFFVCLAGRRQVCYQIWLCCDLFVSEYRHLIILARFNWLLNVFVPVVYILSPVCLHILKCNLLQILSYCLCSERVVVLCCLTQLLAHYTYNITRTFQNFSSDIIWYSVLNLAQQLAYFQLLF